MSEDQAKQWATRIERGETNEKRFHDQSQRGLDSYAKPLNPKPSGVDQINALLGYRHVESRTSQLYYQTPEINLTPIEPQAPEIPLAQILPLREKFLNDDLGDDGADLQEAMHETLVDLIAASGFVITKIGFEQVSLPAGPDPVTGVAPTNPDGTPLEIPIWSRRFITPVSSRKLIIPSNFRSVRFDQSPFLSVKGVIDVPTARRMKWALPEDFVGSTSKDDATFGDTEHAEAIDPQCEYIETWYKASVYDPTVFNPELYRCLIMVKGVDTPVWHVDSPYQSLTPEGALTDDSMRGNPIHVGVIRNITDSSHVPSDLVIGEQLAQELNTFRTGQMRSRRSRRPVTLINDRAGQNLIDKVAANAGPVPTPEEYFDGQGGQRLLAITPAPSEPRDNYTAQQIIEHDWQSAMGGGENQSGQTNKKATTATEVKNVQANSSARAKKDENRIRKYVVKLIRKYDAVVQRTATQHEVMKVLGPQGAALWMQWQGLPVRYAYKIQPDAGRFVDATEYRTQKVNEYNLFRKDELVEPAELLTQVFTALGYDAAKIVRKPGPPKPEPVKISVTFNVEQAMAVPAEMKLLLSILSQQGYQIPPEISAMLDATAHLRADVAAMMPPPAAEHGGSADRTEPINKHQTEKTGGVQGVGRTM